jgi:hypothetical protein
MFVAKPDELALYDGGGGPIGAAPPMLVPHLGQNCPPTSVPQLGQKAIHTLLKELYAQAADFASGAKAADTAE